MAATDPNLANLSAENRQVLERWLAEFDQSWKEGALEARVRSLPPAGSPLRRPALVEMVKIDLERCWRAGRRVPLEDYLRRYPDLGGPDTVPADLIQAEIEVRHQLGDTAELVDFGRRFPKRADELRRLLGQPVTKPVASTTPAPPSERLAKKPRPNPRELPERFGRYQILKKLGQGGMGAVYLALDSQLDRRVALKVPHFGPEDGPDALERFRREAKAAATLHHPNLCPVYDVGEQDGVHFLTMAFIEGKPLSDVLKDGKGLPPRPAAMIVRMLALALQEAHARGVIHRDLKPSNIMLGPRQEPVIMDFGLARRAGAQEARLTKLGSVMGTPAYMAPEQVKGDVDAMGPGCDVYGLGVILYEMLAGKPPFAGPVMAVLGMVLTQQPEPPSKHRLGLDPALEAICLKAMAKELRQRYASMAELAAALTQYLGAPTLAASATTALTDAPTDRAAGQKPAPSVMPPATATVVVPPRQPKRRAGAGAPAAGRARLPWLVAGGALLVALAAIVLATVIFRVRTRMGVIVLTINEPGAQVYVDDELKVTITSPSDKEPIQIEVPEGEHEMKVKKGGFVTMTRRFTLRPGTPAEIQVELRPDPALQAKGKEQDGWAPLFNGKDLDNWQFLGAREAFAVNPAERAIMVKPSKPWSELMTPRDYADFHLRLEFRIVTKNANSGVNIRMPADAAHGSVQAQVQIRDDSTPYANSQTGGIYWSKDGKSHFKREREDLLFPFGEWNKMEVIARGPAVRVVVNGKQALLADLKKFAGHPDALPGITRTSGRITLEADRGEVWYRNIQIKEIKGGPGRPDVPMAEAGFVPLFNGKDLTGWKEHPEHAWGNWRVVDGFLVGSGKKYNWLFTERGDFADVHVRVEAQIGPGGNSGVSTRAELEPKLGVGYEANIGAPGLGHKTGALFFGGRGVPVVPVNEDLVPADTWFTLENIAVGNRIVILVNGKVIVDYTDKDATHRRGHIALQMHDPKTVVRFRKIEAREIKPGDPLPVADRPEAGFVPLFNGKDLAGWGPITPQWRVEGGAIVGEVPPEGLPKNLFLSPNLPGPLKDFELRLEAKMIKGNSGVQVRSRRVEDHAFTTMLGPQVEIAHNAKWTWSSLVTEPAGNPALLAPLDKVNKVLRPADFNEMHIRCVGKHIMITLNGTVAVDDDFPTMPESGLIGLQIHKRFPGMRVEFRNIRLKELAAGAAAADHER
jgi:predicted Ser/Thr protein kinase